MAIIFKNVSFKDLLKNINYEFEEGKITSITGASGSGKTLLAYLLANIKKPSKGEVINSYNSKELGFVLQYPSEQFFNTTVYEEIAFGLKKYNYKLDRLDKHIKDALTLVDLPLEYLDRNPFSLSSGEQEKLAIAIALSLNPKVIILDEPTIYLDNKSTINLIKLLNKLNKKYHKTIIIISNNVDFIYKLSNNILFLKKGKIFYNSKKEEIDVDKLLKSGFEVPKIIEFINYAKKKKNIKLNYTMDLGELMKDVYRNAK